MNKIPNYVKAKSTELRNPNQKIPYIIVQTMKTDIVPENMYRTVMTWVNKNPEYDYFFFNDDRCKRFIKDNYPETYLYCFNMLKAGAAKADLFRWLFLYKHGGVYADIDTRCLSPLRKYLGENMSFLSRTGCNSVKINHCVLCVVPKSIVLESSIKYAISNILYLFHNRKNMVYPQEVCGPRVLGSVVNELLGRKEKDNIYKLQDIIIKISDGNLLILSGTNFKKHIIEKYKNYSNNLNKMKIKTYNKTDTMAFVYEYAEKIVNNNNYQLDFSLMNDKYYPSQLIK